MQVTAAELRSGPHLSYNHDGNVVAQQPGAAAARVYVSKLLVQDYHEVMAADKDIDGDISDAPTTFTVAVQFPRDVTDISLNHVSRAAYAQAANAYNRKMFGPLPPSEASKHIFPEMAPMVGELNSADIAILAAAHVFKPTSLTAMAVAIGAMETSNPQAWAAEVDLIDYITSLSVPVHMYNTCSILTVARLFYEAALCMYLESGADADTCNNKLAVVDHFKRTVKAAPALQPLPQPLMVIVAAPMKALTSAKLSSADNAIITQWYKEFRPWRFVFGTTEIGNTIGTDNQTQELTTPTIGLGFPITATNTWVRFFDTFVQSVCHNERPDYTDTIRAVIAPTPPPLRAKPVPRQHRSTPAAVAAATALVD